MANFKRRSPISDGRRQQQPDDDQDETCDDQLIPGRVSFYQQEAQWISWLYLWEVKFCMRTKLKLTETSGLDVPLLSGPGVGIQIRHFRS
jgi:hypothetical protein